MKIKTEQFKKEARRALSSGNMQLAISRASKRFSGLRREAFQNLPEGETLRTRAHEIKAEAVEHQDEYVERFSAAAGKLGIRVHHAPDGIAACRYIVDLARAQGIRTVVKGKSMTSEEIDLNHTLEQAGFQVWETDLGEFIIQLANEPPSHIIAPALHKTQQEIAALFAEKLGVPLYEDPEKLTMVAREFLREKYFQAGLGISGANFALSRTGTIVILENEGNARFSTTFPRIHVAVVGIEKIIPGLAELRVFLKLLARSATGQKMSTYVSLIQGPGRKGEGDGPEEMHIVLLDNGRSRFRQDAELRSSLYCLRCGACLNVCPVYQRIGGHAYGWVYSGPIGAVMTPQFLGTLRAKDLPLASTLCGACAEVCPVRIPLPDLLLALRRRIVEQKGHSGWERALIKGWAACQASPGCYGASLELARWGREIAPGLFPPGMDLPDKNFHRTWKDEYQD